MTEADVSKLYAAAKKEGKVVWWTGHYTQAAAERIAASFKKKYPGIDIELLRQTGQVLFQRLTQDLKSNVHQVDVFASTDEAHMTTLKKQNALAQFVPADIDKIPKEYQHLDPDDAYQLGDIALMLLQLQPEEAARAAALERSARSADEGLCSRSGTRGSAATSATGSSR